MRGFNPKLAREYVVRDERGLPASRRTVFKLKSLTVGEVEQLKNLLFLKHEGEEKLLIGTQERRALEMGLVGWENFVDEAGKPIAFSRENFDYIPAKYRTELAMEIRGEAELTEDEVKN